MVQSHNIIARNWNQIKTMQTKSSSACFCADVSGIRKSMGLKSVEAEVGQESAGPACVRRFQKSLIHIMMFSNRLISTSVPTDTIMLPSLPCSCSFLLSILDCVRRQGQYLPNLSKTPLLRPQTPRPEPQQLHLQSHPIPNTNFPSPSPWRWR